MNVQVGNAIVHKDTLALKLDLTLMSVKVTLLMYS